MNKTTQKQNKTFHSEYTTTSTTQKYDIFPFDAVLGLDWQNNRPQRPIRHFSSMSYFTEEDEEESYDVEFVYDEWRPFLGRCYYGRMIVLNLVQIGKRFVFCDIVKVVSDVLEHEYIHAVLERLEGRRVSMMLDLLLYEKPLNV